MYDHNNCPHKFAKNKSKTEKLKKTRNFKYFKKIPNLTF